LGQNSRHNVGCERHVRKTFRMKREGAREKKRIKTISKFTIHLEKNLNGDALK